MQKMQGFLVALLTISSLLPTLSVHAKSSDSVTLRKFPTFYQAMLAIDSDADHSDLRKFNEVHTFLDTFQKTPMGKGLGLDISDSFFLHNGSNLTGIIDANGTTVASEMTMFNGTSNTPSVDAPILLHYIRHGWIDAFHSAGDYSLQNQYDTLFTRSQEQSALAFLTKQHIPSIRQFSDHGNMSNVANFGAYWDGGLDSSQAGDNPASPYYITDLLRHEGVRFVWNSRLYSNFSNQAMLFPISLRDGHAIWGYYRYTGYAPIAYAEQWNPYQMAQELSSNNLHQLIASHGYAIIATHLEGNADRQPLPGSAIHALIQVAHLQYDSHQLLVTSTSRLLWYNLVQQGLLYQVEGRTIDITKVHDQVDGDFIPKWQELRGITFQTNHPKLMTIAIQGKPIPTTETQYMQHSIGIAWYPPNTTNWSVSVDSNKYRQLKSEMIKYERNDAHSQSINHGLQKNTKKRNNR
jgi:hypothetical protein